MGTEGHSPELFHAIATQQAAALRTCFAQRAGWVDPPAPGAFAQAALALPADAVQACAYDRAHFGRPGTGRIAVGVYWAFLHRWLQVGTQNTLLLE
jgi:hypothetical protein